MFKIFITLIVSFHFFLSCNVVTGQDSLRINSQQVYFGDSSLTKPPPQYFGTEEKKPGYSFILNDLEKSFTYANWSIAVLAIILALFGIFSLVYYIIDRTNLFLIRKFKKEIKIQKKEIEDIKKSLLKRVDFNYTAVESNFLSMEYLSNMILAQNPELDNENYFLKKINENKAILYLYHDDIKTRRRALKDLQYQGTISSLKTLNDYRASNDKKDLTDLVEKVIFEIIKREGRKEALEQRDREK